MTQTCSEKRNTFFRHYIHDFQGKVFVRNGSFCYLRLIKISLCGALLGNAMSDGPSANLRPSSNRNVTKVYI